MKVRIGVSLGAFGTPGAFEAAGARSMINAFTEAGLSKFVVRPAVPPDSLEAFIEAFTQELMPLQT